MATKVKFVNQNPTQSLIYFNPRSRKGSDELYLEIRVRVYNFNPRSRKGSDLLAINVC